MTLVGGHESIQWGHDKRASHPLWSEPESIYENPDEIVPGTIGSVASIREERQDMRFGKRTNTLLQVSAVAITVALYRGTPLIGGTEVVGSFGMSFDESLSGQGYRLAQRKKVSKSSFVGTNGERNNTPEDENN